MTRKYELLYVLNGTLPADELKAQMDRVQTIVEASAEILDVNEWGRRKLAYEIQDLRDGYYVIVYFMAEPDGPKEIERLLRIADYVLRYLIVTAEGSFVPTVRRSLDEEQEEGSEAEAGGEVVPEAAAEGEEAAAEEVEAEEEVSEAQEEKSEEEPVAESDEKTEIVTEEASAEEEEASPETPERTD